jgi:hypothetical protein
MRSVMRAGEAAAPLLFSAKAKVRAALELSQITHTYVVSYGFASYWANGLGELSQRNKVPPSPSANNKVPFFGNGRTKRESLSPLNAKRTAMHGLAVCVLCHQVCWCRRPKGGCVVTDLKAKRPRVSSPGFWLAFAEVTAVFCWLVNHLDARGLRVQRLSLQQRSM